MIRLIVDYLKERVTGGGQPKVTRAQVLASRPLRNPRIEWEREAVRPEQSRVALLKIPRRNDRFGNFVAKLFRLPDFRKLELDEIGSDVWEFCDGTRTVEQVTAVIVDKYRLNRRQAETSVTAYLRMLVQRRLIVLRAETAQTNGATAAQPKQVRKTAMKQRRQKKA